MILMVFLTSCLFACSSPAQIINSWRDPSVTIENPSLHKIVVAAIIYDPLVRRQVEDYMVSLYPGVATQSYNLVADGTVLNNAQEYDQKFKAEGYDGIVLMKQVNESTSQDYIPGRMPSYYTTWGGYWGNGWGGPEWATTHYNPGTPGHVQTNWTWFVQVNVYSLINNNLIWSAITKTTDPGGRVPLFEDVCDSVRAQMISQGFLE